MHRGKMNVDLLVSLVSEHKGHCEKRNSDDKSCYGEELQIKLDVYPGFFIKRHLMSGSRLARSPDSSPVEIVWV